MISLKHLDLHGCLLLSDAALIEMGNSKFLVNLESLNLSSASVSDKGLGEFFNSKNCRVLEDLDVSLNHPLVGDNTLVNIAYSENLT